MRDATEGSGIWQRHERNAERCGRCSCTRRWDLCWLRRGRWVCGRRHEGDAVVGVDPVIPDLTLRLDERDRACADLRLELRLERVLRIRSGCSSVGERDRIRLGPQVARI